MKKAFLTLLVSLAFLTVSGQGKLRFANDSLHLVYYNPDPSFASGMMASNAVGAGNVPNGVTLLADLYGGTSSDSLSLVTTAAFGSAAGRWSGLNVICATSSGSSVNLPADMPACFQIQIRDNAHATASLARQDTLNGWWGFSPVFTVVPSATSFPVIYQHTPPVNSTWPDGTFDMDNVANRLSRGYCRHWLRLRGGARALHFSVPAHDHPFVAYERSWVFPRDRGCLDRNVGGGQHTRCHLRRQLRSDRNHHLQQQVLPTEKIIDFAPGWALLHSPRCSLIDIPARE